MVKLRQNGNLLFDTLLNLPRLLLLYDLDRSTETAIFGISCSVHFSIVAQCLGLLIDLVLSEHNLGVPRFVLG